MNQAGVKVASTSSQFQCVMRGAYYGYYDYCVVGGFALWAAGSACSDDVNLSCSSHTLHRKNRLPTTCLLLPHSTKTPIVVTYLGDGWVLLPVHACRVPIQVPRVQSVGVAHARHRKPRHHLSFARKKFITGLLELSLSISHF